MVRFRNVIRSLSVIAPWLLLLPSQAAGQTLDPTRALFTASPDHNATVDGTAVVQSYEIGLYIVGAAQPFQRVSIGKPTPDGTGTITVDMTAAFVGWPIVGTSYVADAAAIGPGGTARSALSNTFSFTGGGVCNFSVSPLTPNVSAASGSHTVSVTATSGCQWTGVSHASWITVTNGSAGTGNGTVTYSVTANPSSSSRSGTLTIAGRTVTVTQAGTCTFTLLPTSQNVVAAGATHTASVTAASGCAWTAASNATSWITITSGSSGNGNGTVTYNVAARTATTTRTGTLTIAGQTLTVTQSGTACTFTVASTSHTPTAAGGPYTNAVTTAAGCAWTAVSNVNWITVTTGSGTGNGTAAYTVGLNSSPNQRTGTLTVAGRTVTVTQGRATPPGQPRGIRFVN
jgi:Putative binding domain, N-terminal/Viral BACON domain